MPVDEMGFSRTHQADYMDAVHLTTTGKAGAIYPIGTPRRPSNN